VIGTYRRWTISIEDTEEVFFCREDQALLSGMVAMGKRGIPSGCHGGGCGVCKIRIAAGDYEVGCMSREHVSREEEASGIVLACRAFPRSDLRVEVVGKLAKNIRNPSASVKKYGFV